MTAIVGFSGFARSGKDTAAQALLRHGFTRVSFADIVREFALAVDPLVMYQKPVKFTETTNPGRVRSAFRTREKTQTHEFAAPHIGRLSEVVEEFGWEGAKEFENVRRLLQRIGTEGGREVLGLNTWVDAALGRAEGLPGGICVTDVRFPNEFDAIKDRGGFVLRIERPGVGPTNDHPSETSLIGAPFDAVIVNDSTVSKLHGQVVEFVVANGVA